MGRRHSIAARKASGDASKSKSYSMMSKIIQIAAKKGADPKMNPSLELAIQKAKYLGVTRDIVDRAILKGSGQLEGEDLQEMTYEGYGPEGIAIIIKTLTSNTNRTAQNIRLIMNKFGGTLGQTGSVSRLFEEKGIIISNGKKKKENINGKEIDSITPLNNEEFENEILETSANDFSIEEGIAIIHTSKQDFSETKKQIENLNYNIQEADIQYIAKDEITISDLNKQELSNLINALENDEDVDQVYYNLKE
ncbi:YebC/PmpR family DNA-binding transcriptional regulator [Candidatus Gracilibacteria bacterium]|nr:YebC/PmpR family DNA-binding transcriptional regulator [Candidatus Gracilibacteria bacterium]